MLRTTKVSIRVPQSGSEVFLTSVSSDVCRSSFVHPATAPSTVSIRLSFNLPTHPSTHPLAHLANPIPSSPPSIYPSTPHPSLFSSIHLHLHLPLVHSSICLLFHPSLHLSIHPPTQPVVYLSLPLVSIWSACYVPSAVLGTRITEINKT